jgi:UPF0042 nucleotide-binding protein
MFRAYRFKVLRRIFGKLEREEPPTARVVIVTGQSGAGRTLALRAFEDLGYYCVDNLPPSLLGTFAELVDKSGAGGAAIAIDVRGGEFFRDLHRALDDLRRTGKAPVVVFLEADENVLVNRYKLSRRAHPLGAGLSLLEAIREERRALEEIRAQADAVIDTSHLSPTQLREQIARLYALDQGGLPFLVRLVSFGFKHGIPTDVDLVLDVRFLPNPHYVPELAPLTGQDAAVVDWVLKWPLAQETLVRLTDLLHFLLPLYRTEGKALVTVAIGCTGGQHRSVVFANHLADRVRRMGFPAVVEHRDVNLDVMGDDG